MEDIMRLHLEEWYRGNELGSGHVETPNTVESTVIPQAPSAKDTKTAQNKAADEEDARWAVWMEQVKIFIRNIDVDKL